MQAMKLIARFLDGRIMRGQTQNLSPFRPTFHFHMHESGQQPRLLHMKDLKALFFVKSFTGNKDYHERKEICKGDPLQGRTCEVRFTDGEVIQGSTMCYDPHRLGFFFVPADPAGNNLRIFVVNSAVADFRFLGDKYYGNMTMSIY